MRHRNHRKQGKRGCHVLRRNPWRRNPCRPRRRQIPGYCAGDLRAFVQPTWYSNDISPPPDAQPKSSPWTNVSPLLAVEALHRCSCFSFNQMAPAEGALLQPDGASFADPNVPVGAFAFIQMGDESRRWWRCTFTAERATTHLRCLGLPANRAHRCARRLLFAGLPNELALGLVPVDEGLRTQCSWRPRRKTSAASGWWSTAHRQSSRSNSSSSVCATLGFQSLAPRLDAPPLSEAYEREEESSSGGWKGPRFSRQRAADGLSLGKLAARPTYRRQQGEPAASEASGLQTHPQKLDLQILEL